MGWADLARSQCGVVSRKQLLESAVSAHRIDTLVASGALEPVWRGIFLVRGAPFTYEARLWAAVTSFDGVLGFATGSHLWGMCEEPDVIEVIVARHRHLWRQPGVRTHRIDLPPWAVTLRHGLPVTLRRETALDYLGRLRRSEGAAFADRALQKRWLMPRDFEDRVRRQPGRIGNTFLRQLAVTANDGAAAESERVLHRLLRSAAITGWTPNRDVWIDGELVGVVDVAFDGARLAIEMDGLAFHSAPDRFQADRTKQNRLVGAGWTVVRFTWGDLKDRPGYVLATIRAHLANSGSFAR